MIKNKSKKYYPINLLDNNPGCKSNLKIIIVALIFIQILVFLILYLKHFESDKAKLESSDVEIVQLKSEHLKFGRANNVLHLNNSCSLKHDYEKFDCHPEEGGNEELCAKRNCCWEPSKSEAVPSCFYPSSYKGYTVLNITYSKRGMKGFLKRTFPSAYPDDVQLAKMEVQYLTTSILHVKISDANAVRYEPPYPDIPMAFKKISEKLEYNITLSNDGLKVVRSNGDILFDFENVGEFIFADQFLQISGKFQGKIYGLGEHQSSFQLNTNWTKFTMFNHDGDPFPNANLYGSHPFYLVLEPSGSSHGVFFHNSNAMDVLLQPLPAITFRSIGGIFDFYFFTGPTPTEVIQQYTEIIGRPFLPPYWSLGFHLSRLGYKNTDDIKAVWKRTRAAGIPFDTQWHDIDYMDKRNDFTYDKVNYKDLPKFVDEIHEVGMKYIPILDPGISGCEPNGSYPPYETGVASNVFVKSENGSIFVGKVWNSKCTVFPDFTSPNTVLYWGEQLLKLHGKIPFDGIWLDMNEPANFLDGTSEGCPNNKWEHPVYLPSVLGGKLFHKTICMSAKQYAGLHYNLHNLYGISEAIATNRALRQLGKRPFIISRSTYPGSGQFAGHWSGDVVSTWHGMKQTIPQLLSFSLFGIPMMGADICGFNGNTSVQLCQRWSQLGAFYPFSRNHNTDDAIAQDPAALGEAVVNSAKKALLIRYTFLPYLYTLFFEAHTKGLTVARPLFFEFGNDARTHSMDESFLWGCCLLIVPALKEYATTVKTYFPAATWYNWYTGTGFVSNGTEIVIKAPSDTIPLFLRGGGIFPTQHPNVTTTLSRLNPIELLAAYNESLGATGSFYWDDGESLNSIEAKNYGLVDFRLTRDNFTSHIIHWGYDAVPKLGSIKIFGFIKPIKELFLNKKKIKYQWNKVNLVLSVDDVNLPMNIPFELSWKVGGI